MHITSPGLFVLPKVSSAHKGKCNVYEPEPIEVRLDHRKVLPIRWMGVDGLNVIFQVNHLTKYFLHHEWVLQKVVNQVKAVDGID